MRPPTRLTRRAVLTASAAIAGGLLAGCGPGSGSTALGPAADVLPLTVTRLLRRTPYVIAHRGGSANWPEMTMAAYERSVAAGVDALEVSVHRTRDGVFVCAHDATLGRVTGVDAVIAESDWSQLADLQVNPPGSADPDVGPAPLTRLEEVLDAYAGQQVLFVEDKTYAGSPDLLALLTSYPRTEDRLVWKVFGNAGSSSIEVGRDAGLTTWGYWFADGMAEFAQNAGRFDLIGVDYACTDEQFAIARAAGKPMTGHILRTAQQVQRVRDAGCDGLMVANVQDLVG